MSSKAQQGQRDTHQGLAASLWAERETLVARLAKMWAAELGREVQDVAPALDVTLKQLQGALAAQAPERWVSPFVEWAETQAEHGMEVGTLLRLTRSLQAALWDLSDAAASQVVELRDLMDIVAQAQVAAVERLTVIHTSREQARIARLTAVQDQLVQQVRELASPVIKVWEEVLVLPLVGHIDADRAGRLMEDLLQGIVDHQAEIVIIDVTGVPVVDTHVVNHLVRTIKAAGLLGAQSVLVGIRAEMAQTIVQLGLNLASLHTRANLQDGIEFALERLDLQIVPGERTDA